MSVAVNITGIMGIMGMAWHNTIVVVAAAIPAVFPGGIFTPAKR